jgi:hypothetical protein
MDYLASAWKLEILIADCRVKNASPAPVFDPQSEIRNTQ